MCVCQLQRLAIFLKNLDLSVSNFLFRILAGPALKSIKIGLRLPLNRAASLVISHTIFSLFFVHITGGKTPQNTLGHVNFIAVRDEFNLPI